MPQATSHWEGIADSSMQAAAVWLYRERRPEAAAVGAKANSATPSSSSSAPSSSSSSLVWKPMRKSDCHALNQALIPALPSSSSSSSAESKPSSTNPKLVHVEGGRSTADVSTNSMWYNFVRGPERELCHAVWFVREEKGSGGSSSSNSASGSSGNSSNHSQSSSNRDTVILHPVMDPIDAALMETLYQKAVVATSSLGKGIASMLQEEVMLHSGKAKIQVFKVGDALTLRKIPVGGWQLFSNSQILQRGYGEYTVPGEDTEVALGPVKHVIFIVHGIGEALFSREDVKVAGLIEQVNMARIELQRKQQARYQKECMEITKKYKSTTSTSSLSASATSSPGTASITLPPPPNRLELIPVEWYHRMHDSNSDLMKSLQATTLQTIPALRAIANDVVFDVLMYMTPTFCQSVLETVTQQINDVYRTFQRVHPDFLASGGTVSLAGHSLGSVICWDLLALLKQKQELAVHVPTPMPVPSREPPRPTDGIDSPPDNVNTFHPTCTGLVKEVPPTAETSDANKPPTQPYGPTLVKTLPTIAFVPEHTLFLGSPLGLFLTLRGAHAYFDSLRLSQRQDTSSSSHPSEPNHPPTQAPLVSPFTLPTKRLYNIFHPSDPVAYRIEPLLLGQDQTVHAPSAMYLTVPGEDVRLHVKAMQLGDVVRKTLFEPKRSGTTSGWGTLAESLGRQLAENASSKSSSVEAGSKTLIFPLGGTNGRVDYCLQPGLIENEYISAVTAHSNYFTNSDIQDFLIGLLASKD